ncbi:hypothetical protein [uncultured Planococcus sp.]|uniref:hypothetical protein n=1 Tax=uncultured Planococcus sp. TaxID=337815 RepID=UPI002629C681|nr:hypothetical protein [uncultured Planococcus sp.]
MVPLNATLNESKHARNPFEWITEQDIALLPKFEAVIEYLSGINGLTSSEYRDYVYWCFDNRRSIDEVLADKRYSVDIWAAQLTNAKSNAA